MRKIIFFDIDGTIWDSEMQIPESAGETIKELKANGHLTFLCSGRAKSNICSEELLGLGFDGVIAACGNHVEMNGNILYENILTSDIVRSSMEVLRRCNMPVVLEGPQYHWIDEKGFEEDPYIDNLLLQMGKTALPLKEFTNDIHINKFSADIIADTDYETVKKELSKEFDILEHEGNVVEFIPKGTSKATGIQWLIDHLNIDKKDTYAVGDSINDLDMLEFVEHGIAMGNGSEVAKNAAEYITTELHEDGIRNAMKHYNLI